MPRAQPGQRFGGRAKGTLNKTTTALKEAILLALEGAHEGGSVGYLKWLALEHPPVFGGLVGKVLPLTVAGDPNAPLEHRILKIEGGLPALPMGDDFGTSPDNAESALPMSSKMVLN